MPDQRRQLQAYCQAKGIAVVAEGCRSAEACAVQLHHRAFLLALLSRSVSARILCPATGEERYSPHVHHAGSRR
ncbi:MAG TPA: hypothetical protein VFR34_13195 [Paracoccaceae bacterium]|nr:hypothetical protein [Paracoccaceae bacterium]